MDFKVCSSASEGLFFFPCWRKKHCRPHLLAHLTGDVRLQPPCEDLVNDAVAMVGIVSLFPVIICKQITTFQLMQSSRADFACVD